MKKHRVYFAVADGLFRGFLLFLISEFTVSRIFAFDIACVLTTFFVALSFAFTLITLKGVESKQLIISILISDLLLLLTILLNFLNYLGPYITVFPRRELTDADGILVIIFQSAFLSITAILRFAAWLICTLKQHKAGQ